MSEKPEALRLADWCDMHSSGDYRPSAEAAAELRRQHELIQEMREALRGSTLFFRNPGESNDEAFERMAAAFYADTGFVAPGKNCLVHHDHIRVAAFEAWIEGKRSAVRAALAKAEEQR